MDDKRLFTGVGFIFTVAMSFFLVIELNNFPLLEPVSDSGIAIIRSIIIAVPFLAMAVLMSGR